MNRHISRTVGLPVLAGLMGLLWCNHAAFGATITANSCSNSDIQTAINAANSGDTVLIPGGSCTWTATVTIPSTKGITLNGQGKTTIKGGAMLSIVPTANIATRVTGMTFSGTYTNSTNLAIKTGGCGGLASCGGTVSAFVRIDHNTFSDPADTAIFIELDNNAPVLVDDNTFTGGSASEMIHNMAMGASDASGWTDTVMPGSPYMPYVETNTFSYSATGSPAYFYGTSALQGYYGSRTVFRNNTCNMCQFDQHGADGNPNSSFGARWWEVYNNTFNTCVANANQGTYIVLRGGSGVVFGNVHNCSDTATGGGIDLQVECGSPGTQCSSPSNSYPQKYQVGRGINNNASPAYFWNLGGMSVGSDSNLAQAGRDFFSSATQPATMARWESSTDNASTSYTYSPFAYPFPLDGNGMPLASGPGVPSGPTAPTGLTATVASASQINLSWTASTDSAGVTGYRIYRNALQVATSVSTSYSDTDLAAATNYTYTVVAYDAAGNNSSPSAAVSATTLAATQPPSTPTNLTATAMSSSQVNMNWTASTGSQGVAGYYVYRNGSQAATSATNSYSDNGLAASTTYTYTVSAYDGSGNVSPQSTPTSATTQAAQTTGFIPSSRTIDWTHAGIPGGIPSANWPVYATVSPSGGADDSVAIQTAINAAPAGSVVQLNPGTYTLHRSSTVCYGKSDDYATGVYEAGLCLTDKPVALRGAGPNQTILQYGDGANIISLGQTYLSSSAVVLVPVTSTASQGATQLTLKSATGITANSYVVITQTNPTDPADGNPLVSTAGYTGSCTYCGHDLPNTVMSQIDKVTAVSGNVITLERPLYFNYSNSPQVYHIPMIESAGLENLRVTATAASGTALEFKNINLESCAHCWVHNVESDWAVDKSNIYLSDVYGSEISSNYLYEGYNHNSGANYSLLLEFRNSENLIQNNIIRKARHSTPQSGSSGNVYGYNYELDAYMGEYHNSLPETDGHAAHPFMNLWEGNVTPNFEFDFAHGSSSHNTLFRNYIDLTSTNPDTGAPMTSGIIAMNVAYYSNYENLVGNVWGSSGSSCPATTYETNADTSKVNGVIYQLGYYDDGGGTSPNLSLSAKVGSTVLRGGNWDCVSKSVVWNSNVPQGSLVSSYLSQQTLASSLYLASVPAWYSASGAVFPAIGPGGASMVNPIPAQLCYQKGPGAGAAFNPSSCYGGGTATGPQPPTNLAAVAH